MAEDKKSVFAGRLVRFVLWGLAAVSLLSILIAATLPLWISPVATSIAGGIVPNYTGTDFRIDGFHLNPYSGTLRINGVKLSNPQGFGDMAAFSLADFSMEVEVGSLFSDTILVKEVLIEDAFASYYSHDGRNNFDVIMANVKKATEPKAEAEASTGKSAAKDEAKKKVIIERLRIAGTKVKLMKSDMLPPFIVPTVELTDIGKKSSGATFEEAWTQIANGVMKSFSKAGDGFGALGGVFCDGFKGISGKTEGNAVSKMFESTGDTAKGTVDAVGDTTKKAADGVKNLFKGLGK